MVKTRNLTSLREGEIACVSSLLSTGAMRRRLQDLGFAEGTWVLCAQRSPSGDPTAYEVRGSVIALRNEDARNVLVV